MEAQPLPDWALAAFERCASAAVDLAGAQAFDALEGVLICEMDDPRHPERKVVSSGVMSLLPDEAFGTSEASEDQVDAVRDLIDRLTNEIRAGWSGAPPALTEVDSTVASAVYVLVTTG